MSEIKTKDAVEILEYVLENRVMSYSEALTLRVCIKRLNEHDALKLDNDALTVGNARLRALLEFHGDNKNHHHELYNAITARAEKAEAEVERLIELIVDSGQCIIIKECPAGDCKHCIRDYLKERDEIEKISRESDAFDSEMNCGADAYEDTES